MAMVCFWSIDLRAQSSALPSLLDTLIANSLPKGSNVGLYAYDLTADEPLYAYQADHLCRPASTMKLLTAITSLAHAEADRPLRTELWMRGVLKGDTLVGDLIVVGGFDPEFPDEALDSLAHAVAALSIRCVCGRVVGDVSLKDSLYWGKGWAWDDAPEAFQPSLSPLMLNRGVVRVSITPAARRGDTATVNVYPASTFYTVTNHTRSHLPSAGPLTVSRDWVNQRNEFVVTGNADARRTTQLSVFPSHHFFLHTFADRLRASGISLLTPEDSEPYPCEDFSPTPDARLVMAYETPVQDVLTQMLKESDNLCAEAMLCRLAHLSTGRRHLSASDGLQVIDSLITTLGHNPKDYELVDGSGLSNYNYVTPRLLVDFLRFAYSRPDVYPRLLSALPIGGVDGTLQYRMRSDTPSYRRVHAKTGSLTGISCLAGYLRDHRGHHIAFAIMNQNVLSARLARRFQDKVCDLLQQPSAGKR